MRRSVSVRACAVFLLILIHPLFAGRTWVDQPLSVGTMPFDCGVTPSMTLLFGVQPVVSNYSLVSGPGSIIHRTPAGWTQFSDGPAPGYIAGNADTEVISHMTPVTRGANGTYYSYEYDVPVKYRNGSWVQAGSALNPGQMFASVTADSFGQVIMGAGNKLAKATSSGWKTPKDPSMSDPNWWQTWYPIDQISQIAVSPLGDQLAVTGFDNGSNRKCLAWYDYKLSAWCSLFLGTSGANPDESIAVGWDPKGNLGVAYSYLDGRAVAFDYLDFDTNQWTHDVLKSDPNTPSYFFKGTALAYDRFGNPVVASGGDVFYDPLVPEPMTLFLFGVAGLLLRRRIA